MIKDFLRILGSAAIIAGIALFFLPTANKATPTEETLTKEIQALQKKLTVSEESLAQLQLSIEQAQETPADEAGTVEQQESPAQPEATTQVFRIQRGADSEQVSKNLQSANIIKDASQFEIDLAKQQRAANIQIGEYELSSTMTHQEIISIITAK